MRLMGCAAFRVDSEHVLLLKGLLLLAVVGCAFLGAWHYGLLQRVWVEDTTGMSSAITVVFMIAAGNGCLQVVRLSRALNHVEGVERYIANEGDDIYRRAPDPAAEEAEALGQRHPSGCVTAYIRKLYLKARYGGPRPLDQRLLLESFETELRHGHGFGWFVADLLLTLGLLGTVIGFIMMLRPISGVDAGDHAAIRTALGAMSDGMAVALYTTLTGLIGGMLLKAQGLLLEGAVDELMRRTTQLTEVYVLPAIERARRHAPA